jgi:hypothetical protein
MVRANLRPSWSLAVALNAVHAGAAATLLHLDLSLELKLAGAAAVLASLCHAVWRNALLRGHRAIIALEIDDQENGAICARDGIWHEVKVLGTSYVTPRLTVINIRRAGARLPLHVLLTTDNVDPDDFRKIRVLLRWARPRPPVSTTAEELDARSA